VSSRKRTVSKKQIRRTTTRTQKNNSRQPGKGTEIENLVKAGVERFILKESTIADFMKTIRSASEAKYVYAHQLTKKRFLQIVKQAIRKRNQRTADKKGPSR